MQPREIVLDGDGSGAHGAINRDELSQRLRAPLAVVTGSLQHLLKHWDTLADRDRKVLVKAIEAQADQAITAIDRFEDELAAGEPRIPIEMDEAGPRF